MKIIIFVIYGIEKRVNCIVKLIVTMIISNLICYYFVLNVFDEVNQTNLALVIGFSTSFTYSLFIYEAEIMMILIDYDFGSN